MTAVKDSECNAVALEEKDLSTKRSGVRTQPQFQRRKDRICFFGHFGLGNFGNESTLQAMLFHVRRLLPDAELCCICTGPVGTAATHNIATLPISRPILEAWKPRNRVARMLRTLVIGVPSEIYRWFEGLVTLNGTDVLIVPGTGLVTDAYSLRGWGPYSLFKWSLLAKMRGCKLLVVSVGAGPIYGRLGRFLVKSALGMADFRSYRDESSLHYLKSIGFEPTTDRVYPDLAFSLPQALIPHSNNQNRRRRVVGLGVMLDAGMYSVEKPDIKTCRNYLENLAIFVGWLLAHEYDVRLLIGDLCDRPVIEEFKCMLKERLPEYEANRIFDDEVLSTDQLLSQLADTDLVVATRFHNVLLALLNNKPVVAISFHHKVASLMSSRGLSEYCLDINDLKADKLIEQFRQLEKNAEGLKPMIRRKAEGFREALDDQYNLIVQSLASR